MDKKRFLIIFIVSLFFTSCRSPQTAFSPTSIPQLAIAQTAYPEIQPETSFPYPLNQQEVEIDQLVVPEPPEPKPGMSSISGILVSIPGKQVVKSQAFFLTPAIGSNKSVPPILVGPIEGYDIVGKTNNEGSFTLDYVKPGDYYLIVDFGSIISLAVTAESSSNPLLISLSESQKYPLGIVYLP